MDFENKEYQIIWNENRLKEERERAVEINSKINFISVVYAIFGVFIIALFKFLIGHTLSFSYVYLFCFVVFVILFVISVINTTKLLTPVDVAYLEQPKEFYESLANTYRQNGIPENDVNQYLLESYRIQLEKALSNNSDRNNRKSKFNYLAMRYALLAIIPYSVCVGIMLSKETDQIQKIEIVNFKDKEMAKSHENGKTIIDPKKVIVRPPIMIKENTEHPSKKYSDSSKDKHK